MNQETAHVVNGIQGAIKFVGHDQRFPQPLRADEVNRLLGIAIEQEEEEPKEEIPFLVGQAVAITEGPFTDFNGTVEEVMVDKGKVRVSVSLFGRPTSVELDYLQLRWKAYQDTLGVGHHSDVDQWEIVAGTWASRHQEFYGKESHGVREAADPRGQGQSLPLR